MNKSLNVFWWAGGLAMAGFFAPTKAAAQGKWSQTQGELGVTCVAGTSGDVATIQGVVCMIANVMSVVFTILAFGGLIMMVWAGFSYMMSGGNSQAAEKARRSITGVVIGIILALASFLILNFIKGVTGVDITHLYFPEG